MSLIFRHLGIIFNRLVISSVLVSTLFGAYLFSNQTYNALANSDRFIQVVQSFATPSTYFGCNGTFNDNLSNSYYRKLNAVSQGSFVLQFKTSSSQSIWETFTVPTQANEAPLELMMRMNPDNSEYTKTIFTMQSLIEIEDHALSHDEIAVSQDVYELISLMSPEQFKVKGLNLRDQNGTKIDFEYPVTIKYSFEKDFGIVNNEAQLIRPNPIAILGHQTFIRTYQRTYVENKSPVSFSFFDSLNYTGGLISCGQADLTYNLNEDIIQNHYDVIAFESRSTTIAFIVLFSMISLFWVVLDFNNYKVYQYRSKLKILSLFSLHFNVHLIKNLTFIMVIFLLPFLGIFINSVGHQFTLLSPSLIFWLLSTTTALVVGLSLIFISFAVFLVLKWLLT
jgi:hypothetical protein